MSDLLEIMHDPKRKHSPEGILSEDLNYLIEEIVRCDDVFCHDLRDMIFESIQLVLSYSNPRVMREIARCTDDFRIEDDEECTQLYADSFAEVNPIVFDMIERKRQQLSKDPLSDYDGTLYESQFWFQHSGDIWRRLTHGSTQIHVRNDCAKIKEAADKCLNDPSKNNEYCVKLYGNQLSCVPGSYCPYLRHNLMTCMHNRNIKEYQQMRECMERLPNFDVCHKEYVAPPPEKWGARPRQLKDELFNDITTELLSEHEANSV